MSFLPKRWEKQIKKVWNKWRHTEPELTTDYHDLAPSNDISNGEEYLIALEWALRNERVQNIALTGPYGSGKSSIIQTYIKRHPNLDYLKISMATFVEKADSSIPLNPDEIEAGILKQLFYKVDHRKIPQSRYRKLHKIGLVLK